MARTGRPKAVLELTDGELYNDLGGDCYRTRDPQRPQNHSSPQLEARGHHVALEELPQAA
jgi:hypothetical protein